MADSHLGERPAAGAVGALIGTPLRLLTGIFVVCLILMFALRGVFSHLDDELQARGANERARLFIGEEIVLGIREIEKSIYQMAVTQNAAGLARISRTIDASLEKLTHDLGVLKSGGNVERRLRLNLGEDDEVIQAVTYQPDPGQQHVMELIEIAPQLGQVRSRVDALKVLLESRWLAEETSQHTHFHVIDDEIAILLKQMPPYFERLDENANRLFLDGDRRLHALEAELASQSSFLNWLETGLIAVLIILGGAAGALYLRRLAEALEQARLAGVQVDHQREQIETMLDSLSDGVYATDLEGRITFMNAAAEQILGWHEHELVGQQAHGAVHHSRPDGEFYPREHCPLLTVLQEGASIEGDEHFISRDGRFVPVSYRSKPLLQDGVMVGSLVSFQDVTEQLEDKALIRLQRTALDTAANMIVITDRNGIIEYINPAFVQTTGYDADESLGRKTSFLNSGQQEAAFYYAMWDTLLGGQSWDGELVNRRKDGSLYSEQMTITPIFEHGEISHFVAIKRDVTEEAQTRTRLKLLEAAIRETDQAIMITDADANAMGPTIRYVNPAFSRVTGFAPETAVGQRTGILRGPETDPDKVRRLEAALVSGERLVLEMHYRRADGSPYVAELNYAPVPDPSGRARHYIAVLSDISQRKSFEDALRRAHDQAIEHARLKTDFLSNMSHEIRTPMNGIIGMTDLLLDTALNQEQREFTSVVRDSAQALLTIINDILDLSKIEAGKLDVETTDYRPQQVIEGVIELLAAKAWEKKLTLTSFVDPDLPDHVLGDPTRLRQVLLNLVSNAIKFTEQGHVEVSLLADGDRMRCEIRDTGIGISPEAQSKLFQSFSQADSSTTRRFGGTGLGLSISKRLVELMGGDIGVHSEAGTGSTFWFTLPAQPALSNLGKTADWRARMPAIRNRRVLVVDDSQPDRDIIGRYLNSWGLVNDTANGGHEALARLDARPLTPYDIVLIAYAMPGMDGIELARAIRARPDGQAIRLVLMTGYDQRNLFDQARAAGCDSCMTKPVIQSHLFDNLFDSLIEEENAADLNATTAEESPAISLSDALEQGRLVLLVEDNRTNQKVTQLLLNKLGYAVHIVGNGQEAVEAVELLPYAAILMDCQMPVMDGFEATALIRRAESTRVKSIPIIAMTANAMEGDRERCQAAGMDDYLSKPVNRKNLADRLEFWIGKPSGTKTSQPGTQATGMVIDFGYTEDFLGDDPETLADLFDTFCATTPNLLMKLGQAIDARDGGAVKALAHEIKGASGNLGIVGMARIAAELESAALAGDWPKTAALHAELASVFEQAGALIDARFQGSRIKAS